MEQKTKVHAEDGKPYVVITREFDLPLELLFKAYTEPELVAQWMGTKVLKLESKKHGSYEFETSDSKGNPVFRANGVIHAFIPERKITKTFEMEGSGYGVQLELYDFEKLTEETCQLRMRVVYESVEQRDEVLKLPFVQGINWAHNRLQEVVNKLK